MLQDFFITGHIPAKAEVGVYIPALFILSYLIAAISSYIGLTLASSMRRTEDRKLQRMFCVVGALALGNGIWSMHFVGMLAYKMKMVISYDPFLTFVSFLAAVASAYGVMRLTRAAHLGIRTLIWGAVVLGSGVCLMHYTGMAAMTMDADVRYVPSTFILSVIIAVGASGAALWIFHRLGADHSSRRFLWRGLAALVMGAAICGMHYTGMAAAVFLPFADCRYDPAHSFQTLTLIIVGITAVIITLSLVLVSAFNKARNMDGIGYVAISLIGLAMAVLVFQKVDRDYINILENYRRDSTAHATLAVEEVQKSIEKIYQDIRTISYLPSVRKIDRHGQNLDADAGESIQELYNNLASGIDVSEVYIVPVDFNPDRIDTATGKPEKPIMMFDNIVIDKIAIAAEKAGAQNADVGEEIYEYRQMRDTLAWLKLHYPEHDLRSLEAPFLTGQPVITCDNTRYINTGQDKDRTGVIFSVPFYGVDGKLKGMVSAVILNNALQALLPEQDFTLVNTAHHLLISSVKEGQAQASAVWVAQGKPDPNLIFSKTVPIQTNDPQGGWVLWAGFSDQDFMDSEPMVGWRVFKYTAYGSVLLLTLLGLVTWGILQRGFRLMQARQEELVSRLELAGRFAEKERMEKQLNEYIDRLETARLETVKAKDAAERASAAKGDFLANMSHEIRTPMNGVLGMTRLLLETKLDGEQRSWAEIIRRSGENLLEIINDILDFSKIEAGKLALDPAPFNLADAVMNVTDMLMLRTQEKNIELLVDIQPSLPRYVVGDAGRFKQILLNLAGNAVKFTEKGHVLIRISGVEEGDTNLRVRVQVEDTGIGIPKDKIAYVFEKFAQAEESTTRRFGGTGLGLTISNHLVGLMGGKMDVSSETGKGSVFSFDILLAQAATETDHLPAVHLEGIKVLVLGGSPLSGSITLNNLRHLKMHGDLAISADEARARLLAAAEAGEPYAFVILDSHAGSSRILHFAGAVKELPRLHDTMFIAVTPFGQAVSKTSRGIAAFLSKPLLGDQLNAALCILLDAKKKGVEMRPITRHTISQWRRGDGNLEKVTVSFDRRHVLVVEDMKVNQILMTRILEKMGCQIHHAANGKEAVDELQNRRYDIVFMDCQMPEMDGFEATRLIREKEEAGDLHTTIVALTADAMTGDREKCLHAGMDDYVNKPFRPEQIAEMMQKWCA